MSGVYLTRHGGPDALEWCDTIPVPEPGPGQVLVQVLAAGVNNTDINTRTGWYSADVVAATGEADRESEVEAGGWKGALEFPRIQGGDLCGRVVACGRGVTELEAGDRVTSQINIPRPTPGEPFAFVALGSEMDGAFAQYCLAEASELFEVSVSPLSDVEIAAMPCAHGTAWNLLDRAGVKAGQSVLVTGASGGVGMAAVQLASHLGSEVTGMSSPAKAGAVRAAGASGILDRGDTPPKDHFDSVIDVVGGPVWPHLIRALRPGGRYAVSGAIAGPVVEADLREIYLRDITIHGASFSPREVFARLIELVNVGAVRPLVSKTYSLAEIAKAQEDFLAKTFPGKLVLIPPGTDR